MLISSPSSSPIASWYFWLTLSAPEQENLISNLHHQNTKHNALYTFIFTILPLLFTPPFLLILPLSPLLRILGTTSLLISAGRMRFSSPTTPPSSHLRPNSKPTATGLLRWLQLTSFEHRLLDAAPEHGPLRRALPRLNGGICALFALTAVVMYWKDSTAGPDGQSTIVVCILCLLPGIAGVMVEVAMRSMREVETGVGELKRLRYRYKGA